MPIAVKRGAETRGFDIDPPIPCGVRIRITGGRADGVDARDGARCAHESEHEDVRGGATWLGLGSVLSSGPEPRLEGSVGAAYTMIYLLPARR